MKKSKRSKILFRYTIHLGVSIKCIAGETKFVTDEKTAPSTETTLTTILFRYPLENIFNAEKFEFIYQCLPSKTLHFKEEKCSGRRHSKVYLTGLATGNVYGEKVQMFVIGKSVKPRCFKSVKTLPCQYRAPNKSWMSGELFKDWVYMSLIENFTYLRERFNHQRLNYVKNVKILKYV